MRISDTECGAICLLNVTAELHQSFVPVKQKTCEANIHADMWRHLTVAVFNHNLQQGSRDTWRWATLASNWRAIRLKGNLARRMYLNQFAHQLYNILFAFVRRLRGFTFSLVELYFCQHTHQFIKQKSSPFCFSGESYPKRSINKGLYQYAKEIEIKSIYHAV